MLLEFGPWRPLDGTLMVFLFVSRKNWKNCGVIWRRTLLRQSPFSAYETRNKISHTSNSLFWSPCMRSNFHGRRFPAEFFLRGGRNHALPRAMVPLSNSGTFLLEYDNESTILTNLWIFMTFHPCVAEVKATNPSSSHTGEQQHQTIFCTIRTCTRLPVPNHCE